MVRGGRLGAEETIGDSRGPFDGGIGHRADQQRRYRLGCRAHRQRRFAQPPSGECLVGARPAAPDDLDALLQEAGPIADAAPEGGEFGLPIALPDTEIESAVGEQREGGGVFGEADRVV